MLKKSFSPLVPKVVLGIAAHPDDLDFGAAGTMAKFAREGADVHYLIITDGSKGSSDPEITKEKLIATREQEQRTALLDVIGGKSVEFLGYTDGELEVTMDLKKQLVKAIRTIKPDVVVTMDPKMLYAANRGFINHPDHRAAGQATLDAVYPLARDRLAFEDLLHEGYEPHNTPTVLLINLDDGNFCVDITDTFETKIKALEAHTSQIPDIQKLRTSMETFAREHGKSLGCDLAEVFVRIDIQ